MTTFLLEFRNIFVFIICSFGLAIILLAAVYILSFTSKIDLEKSSVYECGFQPFSETSYPFEVQFAVIAIMFLLFDIEVLYLFPLIQSLYSLYTIDITIIVGFYFILLVGLLYEISRKVLDFQTNANITEQELSHKMQKITIYKEQQNDFPRKIKKKRFFKYKQDYLYALVLIVLSLLPILNSSVPFIISILVAALIFSKPFSIFFKLKSLQEFLFYLIVFLHRCGFVSFVFHFFNYFFNNDLKVFKIRIIILNCIIVLHAGVSRYYFIYKDLNIFIFLLLVIGFISIYIRFCINIYIFINATVIFFEEDSSESTPFLKKLFNFNYHNHNHNHFPPPPEKIGFFTKLGIAAAVGTCFLGAVGVYKQHEQLIEARLANEQARLANEQARLANEHHLKEIRELERQNDLEALSQGLIPAKFYCAKYPNSCNVNHIQEMANRMEASKKAGMPGIKSTNK